MKVTREWCISAKSVINNRAVSTTKKQVSAVTGMTKSQRGKTGKTTAWGSAMTTDWRLPENRRELFQRLYTFHLKYKAHPGCVYSLLPAIAEHYELDEDGKAWLTWLNGNTQNPAMSLLLLEASDLGHDKHKAIDFWNEHFKLMEWDTDRRHQKSKFGEATVKWWELHGMSTIEEWQEANAEGWDAIWDYSYSQPYMGRLSAWSMLEYAKILGLHNVDASTLLLSDKKGSQSHRNGLSLIAGYDATYWDWDDLPPGLIVDLELLGEDLLAEAKERNIVTTPTPDGWKVQEPHQDVGYLTMESALCTFKSMWKPDRRYPGVYADMAALRIWKAEARFPGHDFSVLWEAREKDLPEFLRLEAQGSLATQLDKQLQNQFRETGQPVNLGHEWEDM